MDLRTARFIRGKSQSDLERDVKVFQSKISRFEVNDDQCLNHDEKKRIEQYLQFSIDWNFQEPSRADALTEEELKDVKLILEFLMRKSLLQTAEWASSFNHFFKCTISKAL